MNTTPEKIEFTGSQGDNLAARLELPQGQPRAFALFAHCFTCSKDLHAARAIAGQLAQKGIGVLRFDFTGLGHSGGDFANTNFSSNVGDLVAAAAYLRDHHQAPAIIIGHSLGGAAVLAAAQSIPEIKAVATIGAPSDVAHVLHNFDCDIDQIETEGEAVVNLAGREFRIKSQFIDDANATNLEQSIAGLKRALLVMHAPLDQTVGIENAAAIFSMAKHPKSFVSLDDADHLLSRRQDAEYAAGIIASWAERYLPGLPFDVAAVVPSGTTRVSETGAGKFQQLMRVGAHEVYADEPEAYGGLDSGPTPYDLLAMALGACTSMTLKMYADRKGLELDPITVDVSHDKVHADDCKDCGEGREGRIDRFERVLDITMDGKPIPAEQHGKMIEIAGKCPVHRTLEASSAVITRIRENGNGH